MCLAGAGVRAGGRVIGVGACAGEAGAGGEEGRTGGGETNGAERRVCGCCGCQVAGFLLVQPFGVGDEVGVTAGGGVAGDVGGGVAGDASGGVS